MRLILEALDHIPDEEIFMLQGQSREAAIRRIRALEGVQRQLTGVIVQLTQIISSIDESNRANNLGVASSSKD